MIRYLLSVGGWLLLATPLVAANAATLYLSPNSAQLHRGDTVKVSVRLDVDENECANVVDAVLHYSNDIELVDISRGSSIMSMWVEDPVIDRESRTISFAGGIPNGYCGRIIGDPQLTNTVVDLLFQSPGFVIGGSGSRNQIATATVEFAPETQILLNDGAGTRAPATFYGATIVLDPKAGNTINNEWLAITAEDTQPPTPFSILLERSPNAFSNDYFITFNTTDKQSGIDHYEVIEEPLENFNLFSWGEEAAPWQEVKSPYVLKDQTLNSTIRVRAVDKAGNEYIATLLPDESQRTVTPSTYVLLALLGLVALGVLVTFVFFLSKLRRNRVAADSDIEECDDEPIDEYEDDGLNDDYDGDESVDNENVTATVADEQTEPKAVNNQSQSRHKK